MYCLTVEYIRPRGHPFQTIDPTTQPSTSTLYVLTLESYCWGEGKDATLRSRPSLQPLVRRRQSGQEHPSQVSAL